MRPGLVGCVRDHLLEHVARILEPAQLEQRNRPLQLRVDRLRPQGQRGVQCLQRAGRLPELIERSALEHPELELQAGLASMLGERAPALTQLQPLFDLLAVLARMANLDHQIEVGHGDTVILASSLIPGNENAVYRVIDGLTKLGANVVHKGNAKVHVSGHAAAGELLYCYNILKPRNVMPVHGEYRHLVANAKLAMDTGVPERNTILNSMFGKKWDGIIFSFFPLGGGTSTDVDDYTYGMYHSRSSRNFWGYSNPKVDQLAEQQRVTLDPKKRADLIKQIVQLELDDVPRVMTPDLICVLDTVSGDAIGTETLRYGQRVHVLGVRVPPIIDAFQPQVVVTGARRTPVPQVAPTGSESISSDQTTSGTAGSTCVAHAV